MDLTAVPGLPETALGPEIVGRAPASAPPAPWRLELGALVWVGWPSAGAVADLPEGVRAGARVLAGGGGLIHYTSTPVGPYDEALAAACLLHGGRPVVHVPFMAVDSLPSLTGGRRNWSLPKTLATFEGEPAGGATMRARGESWEVSARARPIGPAFPFRVRLTLAQRWPDGRVRWARGRLRGRARLARVAVEASGGAELRGWLRSGTRLGLLVERGRGELGPAEA